MKYFKVLMNIFQKVRDVLNDSLKTFVVFERIIASVCIAIPVILRLYDKDCPHFRYSISKYAYMSNSYIYGMLLCMAAMLFMVNGVVYFKSEANNLAVDKKNGQWYNIILGLSLIGVILFPPVKFHTTHLIFGGIFFLGDALVIGVFQKKHRILGIAIAILTLAAFFLSLVVHLFSLLWAEWVSLGAIGMHLILESKNASSAKIGNRYNRQTKNSE